MRKWRPSIIEGIYVIPEIRGNIKSLEILLNRILPLRKHTGKNDTLICLGNYILDNENGADVIECLVQLKQEYEDRIICLRGEQEEYLIKAVLGGRQDYKSFIEFGGVKVIESYIKRGNIKASPYSLPQHRLQDLIPKSHLEFMQACPYWYETEQFVFWNGGSLDMSKSVRENNPSSFVMGNLNAKIIMDMWKQKNSDGIYSAVERIAGPDRIIITSKNTINKKPFIHPKYMILGSKRANVELLCLELSSFEIVRVKQNRERIYKYNYQLME